MSAIHVGVAAAAAASPVTPSAAGEVGGNPVSRIGGMPLPGEQHGMPRQFRSVAQRDRPSVLADHGEAIAAEIIGHAEAAVSVGIGDGHAERDLRQIVRELQIVLLPQDAVSLNLRLRVGNLLGLRLAGQQTPPDQLQTPLRIE